MMKSIRLAITGGLLALLSGCVPSINPLYTLEDLTFDPTLLGVWENDDEQWSFRQNDENHYKLIHSYKGNQANFSAYLTKINDLTFLDITPSDLTSNNYLRDMHLFPVHTFFSVSISDEQVALSTIDPDRLEKAIEQKKVDIAHVRAQDGRILLTASTKELQNFVQSESELFGDPMVLTRID